MPIVDDLAGVWPSLVFSALAVALWTDYAIGALVHYRRLRTRGFFREYVVALAIVACSAGLAAGVVFAWLPPGEVDPYVVVVLSAVRVVLLAVGLWLAWDRRYYRAKT